MTTEARLVRKHCPGCGGWVATYSGQREGYACDGLPAAVPAEGLEDSPVWKALCDLLDEVLPLLDEPYPYRKRQERLDERMRWFGRAESIARAALARHESAGNPYAQIENTSSVDAGEMP